MNITWHGYSCFRFQESGQGREVTVVTDPFVPEGKQSLPKGLSADLLLVSRNVPKHNNVEAVGGSPFVVDGPGEFEVKDVSVTAVSTDLESASGSERTGSTMYYINFDGLHMLFLGDLTHPLDESHCRDMHEIDVLFVPVGGNDVLSAKQAADLVGQLEPRIIVPMHFRANGLSPEYEGVEPFLKAMGSAGIEPVAKLKLTERDLPQDGTRIVVFAP